jgi:hypothetical protein
VALALGTVVTIPGISTTSAEDGGMIRNTQYFPGGDFILLASIQSHGLMAVKTAQDCDRWQLL